MLEVRNITISYGKTAVLKDVSFGLNNGEIIAVLGANGAGKTTLIRALNGTLPVSKGEILLDGKPFGSFSRRQIAQRLRLSLRKMRRNFL